MSEFNIKRGNEYLRDGFFFDLHRVGLNRYRQPSPPNFCHYVFTSHAVFKEREFLNREKAVELVLFFRFELIRLDFAIVAREGIFVRIVCTQNLSIRLLFARERLLLLAVKFEVIPSPYGIRPRDSDRKSVV